MQLIFKHFNGLTRMLLIFVFSFVCLKGIADNQNENVKMMDLQPPDQTIKKAQDLKRKPIIATRAAQDISFKLPANPSTGYSWFLSKYDNALLTPLSAKYNQPDKKMPGKPGYVLWKFRVKASSFVVPRVTKINLIYARPWELPSGKTKSITVVIK